MALELPDYQIIKQIGTGAGSKIYLAKEFRSGKMFAVKHVERNSSDDDKFMDQVETEYTVSHELDHQYLRHSYSIHRVRKVLQVKEIMLVMGYIDGLSMEIALPNRLNTFLTIFRKVTAGLLAMHEAGYVHSDIKPSNIMIAAKGIVKIIDFGQTCKMNERKLRIQGTPDYIAPEQIRRMPLDQRTDVFNLGATMYWVLTSEKYPTALRGTDMNSGISLTDADKPIAPIEWNDKIPLSLSKLVMECCRDNPNERPSDMKQVDSRLTVVQNLWRKHREKIRDKLLTESPQSNEPSSEPIEENE